MPERVIMNIITLVSIVITGYSGIVMSSYVFPFIKFSKGIMTARQLHLAFSYLAFVSMSIHLGLHWGMVVTKFKIKNNAVIWIMRAFAAAAAVYGAYLFGKAHIFCTYL